MPFDQPLNVSAYRCGLRCNQRMNLRAGRKGEVPDCFVKLFDFYFSSFEIEPMKLGGKKKSQSRSE